MTAGASDAEGPEVGLIKWGKANSGYFAYYLDKICIFCLSQRFLVV